VSSSHRFSSIHSDPRQLHPREIHLCDAIVRYRTKLKILRKGVYTTSYLSGLQLGSHDVAAQPLYVYSHRRKELPFALVLERASFPFLRMRIRLLCVLDREQALRLCVPSLNNACMRDTTVCIADLVPWPISVIGRTPRRMNWTENGPSL
jgi:hypothetical protein